MAYQTNAYKWSGYVCAYEYMANVELLHGCQMTQKPRPTFWGAMQGILEKVMPRQFPRARHWSVREGDLLLLIYIYIYIYI